MAAVWQNYKATVFAALLFAVGAMAVTATSAHDTRHVVLDADGAVAVELFYTDTTAMRFASVQVFSPDDQTQPFMLGRSDENGRFAFLPDVPGLWRVVVDDGDGHVHEVSLEVGTEAITPGSRLSAPLRWAFWASLALNLFLVAIVLARRSKRLDTITTSGQ